MDIRLPAEWEPQDAVLLIWPHAGTDWQPSLRVVAPVFVAIAREVSLFERLIVVLPHGGGSKVRSRLQAAGARLERISFFALPTNDTWARDCGPITVYADGEPRLLDFCFNGWGRKFASDLDDQLSRRLQAAGAFQDRPLTTIGMVLEGGSIESDGRGAILTTAACLLNRNRNPHLSQAEIEQALGEYLGAGRFLWLENGYLAGDDTDSHIDTLARLCPDDVILYTACDDANDEHYGALKRMEAELRGFRTASGKPYRLAALPLPAAKYGPDGERLPATYANFLVINGAVLVPTYDDPLDDTALHTVRQVFPDRQVRGIDCLPLILQHGSLHCVTMQLPQGVLR